LLGQTLRDIEVICVDDASTDESLQVVEAAMARDVRVRLVRHASNQGLSAARNTGLAEAKGEWTLFIDSDDVVSRVLCERVQGAAAALDADVVFFDYTAFIDGESLPREAAVATAVLADRRELLVRRAFAWTKIAKTELLRSKEILFPVGLCFEDVPVHWRLALESAKPVFLPEPHVWYRQRKGSITGLGDWRRADAIRAYDLVRAHLHASGHWDSHADIFLRAEMANWASTHGYFALVNPPLASRVTSEAAARITPEHVALALSGGEIRGWQRDYLLAYCAPAASVPLLVRGFARLRYAIRTALRQAVRRFIPSLS
jgi:glycosyltransferase involved in cell wall biosynthesis